MVSYNPTLQKLRQEDHKSQASLDTQQDTDLTKVYRRKQTFPLQLNKTLMNILISFPMPFFLY